MKMKNLGKLFLLIFFTAVNVFAGVEAKLSPQVAYVGDVVTYSLHVDGQDIQKPNIAKLCGQNVISSGSSTSIEMIGSDYKKTYTLSYQFVAQKSCTVNPVEISIDGTIEKTKPLQLTVKKLTNRSNADFLLDYNVSKKELYVGEAFDLVLTLKQRKDTSVVDSRFTPSKLQGFWKKSESKPRTSDDGQFIITKLLYRLAPQRDGNLTIDPAQLQVASRMPSRSWAPNFMPQVQWKSYFSNNVTLHVKPLPNNASLVGNFHIDAKADKTTIHPGEAVNVIVRVKGDGNLEDIEGFKPYIAGVSVFDEKVKIDTNILTQKLTFIADRSFTIPPLKLHYFDLHEKQVKEIKTAPIKIEVQGAQTHQDEKLKIKTATEQTTQQQVVHSSDKNHGLLMIIAAFIVGLLLGVLGFYLAAKQKKKQKKYAAVNDEKMLLIKLLPFKERDSEVADIVNKLEHNLYEGMHETIDKKMLKEIIKRYDIS